MAQPSDFVDSLLRGQGSLVSYPETSQYSQGSPSGCGLAAFNCARIVLGWEAHQHFSSTQVLQAISEKQAVFDIISICENTENIGHLEAEEIMALPIFKNSLELKNTEFCVPNLNNITGLLRRLSDWDDGGVRRMSCAVVLTKPPEIVVCFKIAHPQRDIYVLFDSHPREEHPYGSAFICCADLHDLAGYLAKLFQVDQSLSDPNSGLQWQAELFNSLSGHYFVCSRMDMTMSSDATKIMVDASLQQLQLRSQVAEYETKITGLTKELVTWQQRQLSWQEERRQMQASIDDLQQEVAALADERATLLSEQDTLRRLAQGRGIHPNSAPTSPRHNVPSPGPDEDPRTYIARLQRHYDEVDRRARQPEVPLAAPVAMPIGIMPFNFSSPPAPSRNLPLNSFNGGRMSTNDERQDQSAEEEQDSRALNREAGRQAGQSGRGAKVLSPIPRGYPHLQPNVIDSEPPDIHSAPRTPPPSKGPQIRMPSPWNANSMVIPQIGHRNVSHSPNFPPDDEDPFADPDFASRDPRGPPPGVPRWAPSMQVPEGPPSREFSSSEANRTTRSPGSAPQSDNEFVFLSPPSLTSPPLHPSQENTLGGPMHGPDTYPSTGGMNGHPLLRDPPVPHQEPTDNPTAHMFRPEPAPKGPPPLASQLTRADSGDDHFSLVSPDLDGGVPAPDGSSERSVTPAGYAAVAPFSSQRQLPQDRPAAETRFDDERGWRQPAAPLSVDIPPVNNMRTMPPGPITGSSEGERVPLSLPPGAFPFDSNNRGPSPIHALRNQSNPRPPLGQQYSAEPSTPAGRDQFPADQQGAKRTGGFFRNLTRVNPFSRRKDSETLSVDSDFVPPQRPTTSTSGQSGERFSGYFDSRASLSSRQSQRSADDSPLHEPQPRRDFEPRAAAHHDQRDGTHISPLGQVHEREEQPLPRMHRPRPIPAGLIASRPPVRRPDPGPSRPNRSPSTPIPDEVLALSLQQDLSREVPARAEARRAIDRPSPEQQRYPPNDTSNDRPVRAQSPIKSGKAPDAALDYLKAVIRTASDGAPAAHDEDYRVALQLQQRYAADEQRVRSDREMAANIGRNLATEAHDAQLAQLMLRQALEERRERELYSNQDRPIAIEEAPPISPIAESNRGPIVDSPVTPTQPQPTFECTICLDEHPHEDLARIDECDHGFGRECLLNYIRSKIQGNVYPIVCPDCQTNQDQHGVEIGYIRNSLVEIIGVEQDEYTQFVSLQLASLAVNITCRSEDCKREFRIDRDQYMRNDILECPFNGCGGRWCRKCDGEVDFGEEHTCGEAALDELAGTEGWKRCPGCQNLTDKIEGCHHMVCTVAGCNAHWCWTCGDLITRLPRGVKTDDAVTEHYNRGRCALFDVPEGV